MRNAGGEIIGLHIRYASGAKAAEAGSRLGLFLPADLPKIGTLAICEGVTDTAAALDLGQEAVGRPSCNCGASILAVLARGRDVVIVGDNDPPGRHGAESLASCLVGRCSTVRILYPPEGIKDLRQWRRSGLTAVEFREALRAASVCELRVLAARFGQVKKERQDER
ncbi:MAG TPA: hypothetical protein DCX07_14365 [Phycisphaerales bacterium]|nr:hypothetical protein [Phycisphaerales bacterium]